MKEKIKDGVSLFILTWLAALTGFVAKLTKQNALAILFFVLAGALFLILMIEFIKSLSQKDQ
ncbi:MAG: hypothetical protein M0R05_06135 [Bacilli bacterium]|nr:hypothetical protein [Bacilli bacterium]MDD4388632.1 hypothetical protein [Bacilli bacterium]